MSDLISRDYLTHKLQRWSEKIAEEYGKDDEYVRCLDAVIEDYLGDAPAVDAVEVVHGRWIWGEMLLNRQTCSCCKTHFDCLEVDNYCPHCGAKMDGGSNETN